jgi:hypothetical protein
VNKKAVNWDGYNSISSQNGKIRDALDCFCTGNNWCYVATHSAGDLMMAYTLANYGGSARYKRTPVRPAVVSAVILTARRKLAGISSGCVPRPVLPVVQSCRMPVLGFVGTVGQRSENVHGARDVQPQ